MLLECDECNATVKAEMVSSFEKRYSEDWLDNIQYTLYKCPQCSSPILVSQDLDYDHVQECMDWGSPTKIFHSSQFHINPVIPEQLRKALVECIRCYKASSFTATVIMSRLIIFLDNEL